MAASSQELGAQAAAVRNLVGWFKTSDDQAGDPAAATEHRQHLSPKSSNRVP
jgi:hypothetical protein